MGLAFLYIQDTFHSYFIYPEYWYLITRIICIQDSFTFTFYVAFIIINFSDLDVGCMFRKALVCWVVVYSDQLLGAHQVLIIHTYHDTETLLMLLKKKNVGMNWAKEIWKLNFQKCQKPKRRKKNWILFFGGGKSCTQWGGPNKFWGPTLFLFKFLLFSIISLLKTSE